MKVEYRFFALVALFAALVAPVYGHFTHWTEWVGIIGLILTAGLGAMVGFYIFMTGRRIGDRPDDNPRGEIAEQEGDYGVFSPHSWWPFWLGLSAAVIFLGLAVGFWISFIGAFVGIFALIGWTFEYYKGPHAL